MLIFESVMSYFSHLVAVFLKLRKLNYLS